MPGGIDGVGFTPSTTQNTPDANSAHAQGVTVQSHGQTIQTQPSVQSLVDGAKEEAGAMLQTKSSQKLSKREARSKSASNARKIMQKYLKTVHGVGQTEKFEQLAESLKNMANPSPSQLRQKIEEFKQQSGEQNFESALLLALEEMLSAEGTHADLLEAVREVKTELGNELKDFYENQIKNYEDVTEVYEQVLGEHSESDFMQATDALITRLGTDLQSQASDADAEKIKATVDSLYHLEVARNTYTAFAGLMDKMQAEFGVSGSHLA